jgi:enoyl-CoA hydratase / long-chain 3-hydroxyacyl-CoA dehydrogenase
MLRSVGRACSRVRSGLGVTSFRPVRTLTAVAGEEKNAAGRSFRYFDNFEVKDGVAIVRLNGPDKMNTINQGMQGEMKTIFEEHIKGDPSIKAVVFISSKPDNFIAGADIDMIKAFENKADLEPVCMEAHDFFKDLKKLNLPFVSAINGAALGGGLEWAMYCDYRIATTSKKTVLGLPEVKLGLMPGMAGTYHLPKLVGYQESLGMILTGKNVKPAKAKKIGLVDLVVDPASLEKVAITQAKGLANGSVKPSIRKRDWMGWFLEEIPFGRNMMFDKAKKTVVKSAGTHYPAPYAILDVLKNNFGKSMDTHLRDEAKKFSELAATSESEALIGIFKGMTEVKKHNFGNPKHDIKTIAVLGAGLMGAGIGQVSTDQGKLRVLLKDKFEAGAQNGQKIISDAMAAKVKKRRMTDFDRNTTMSRVVPLHDESTNWERHFAQADVVIEAVFEEIGVKRKVLAEMEDIISDNCVFASNTSAIPIGSIAETAKIPERVIGMHYFSPVPMMPLLEIIPHAGTADEVCAAAMHVGSKQGKTPIFVKDVPGFYVNRCLGPFMSEVTALILEGVDLGKLDDAMKSFGMPVGPITLCDEVGIDISNHVGKFMSNADLGVRMHGGNPELMQKMIDAGMLGRKSGKGFYLYPKNAKKSDKKQLNPEALNLIKSVTSGATSDISVEDIQMRLISRFVNEAAFCLQDEIIRSPVDGDIGAVFGIGFPPFMGGPFRMLDKVGVKQFTDKMLHFRDQKGAQFEPAQILMKYANENKKFHM